VTAIHSESPNGLEAAVTTLGRDRVTVSRKNSSIRLCDLIVVLDAGRVVEQGRESLLARHGHYAATYAQQTRALVFEAT
jgi:subfamily B ATP-binding cassette protein MsbA